MTKKLIISGGCLRENGYSLGEGKYYGKATLLCLDLETGQYQVKLSKDTGGENYPEEHPNLEFTAGTVEGNFLWISTDTEVHKYQLPEFSLQACFSHPCFHNVHSTHIIDDELIVTSTGVDNVIVMDKNSGAITRILNTEGKDPWHRFHVDMDYRKVHSTRPHDSHPNYVFKLDNDLWVTRCSQEDAVKLSDPNDCINVSGGDDVISVHDGVVWQNFVVFTRVDGFLVFADKATRKVVKTVDPFKSSSNRPVGWCRGLHIDGDMFYIGYSKIRKTKLKSKIKHLAKGNFKYSNGNNALVVAYNLQTENADNVFESPDGLIDAIYGILPFNYD